MRLTDVDAAIDRYYAEWEYHCIKLDEDERAWLMQCLQQADTVDPVHAAGGCYCRECKYADDCMKQLVFWERDCVLEQNVYKYKPLDFCSYGKRKEQTP